MTSELPIADAMQRTRKTQSSSGSQGAKVAFLSGDVWARVRRLTPHEASADNKQGLARESQAE